MREEDPDVIRGIAPAVLLLAIAAPAARSAPIAVANASFEDPAQASMGTFASGTPPGWSIFDPDGVTGPATDFGVWWPVGFFDYANGAQDGLQCGVVFADLPAGTGVVGLRQTLGATLAANTRYSFEVFVGDPTDNSDELLAGFPGYRLELWAGNQLVIADDDTAMQEGQFRPARATIPVGSTHPGLGRPLELRLLNRMRRPAPRSTSTPFPWTLRPARTRPTRSPSRTRAARSLACSSTTASAAPPPSSSAATPRSRSARRPATWRRSRPCRSLRAAG